MGRASVYINSSKAVVPAIVGSIGDAVKKPILVARCDCAKEVGDGGHPWRQPTHVMA